MNVIEAELVDIDFSNVEYEVDFQWENFYLSKLYICITSTNKNFPIENRPRTQH